MQTEALDPGMKFLMQCHGWKRCSGDAGSTSLHHVQQEMQFEGKEGRTPG